MCKANMDIRLMITAIGLRNYQVAAALGIGETTFCRMLRNELSSEKKQEVLDAIKKMRVMNIE